VFYFLVEVTEFKFTKNIRGPLWLCSSIRLVCLHCVLRGAVIYRQIYRHILLHFPLLTDWFLIFRYFSFSHAHLCLKKRLSASVTFRPLAITQTPIQWVSTVASLGIKQAERKADHSFVYSVFQRSTSGYRTCHYNHNMHSAK